MERLLIQNSNKFSIKMKFPNCCFFCDEQFFSSDNFIQTALHFGSLSIDGNVKHFFFVAWVLLLLTLEDGSAAHNTTISYNRDEV